MRGRLEVHRNQVRVRHAARAGSWPAPLTREPGDPGMPSVGKSSCRRILENGKHFGIDEKDPRARGWPCHGEHQAAKLIKNQYMVQEQCKWCQLTLNYWAVPGYVGHRPAPPHPEIVNAALDRLADDGVMPSARVVGDYINKEMRQGTSYPENVCLVREWIVLSSKMLRRHKINARLQGSMVDVPKKAINEKNIEQQTPTP